MTVGDARSAEPSNDLAKAYGALLDLRRCAIIIPSKYQRIMIFDELDRTDQILIEAGAKGLAAELKLAAEKWRADDALADKICDFQRPGWHGRMTDTLRQANDAVERAVVQTSKG